MNIKHNQWKLAGALAFAVGSVTFAVPEARSQSETIAIDGSSTVYPITEAVAEEFQISGGDARVTVGISGTGGGFERFCNGETDISNASRPIDEEEIAACEAAGIEYIEIPVAFDAITVVVNPENSWAEAMTVTELQTLWAPDSSISTWSDIRSDWPNEEITLYGPGTDSGTFDYFTEEIVGEEGASRSDFTASEDDNVLVLGVARDTYALGYFGYAYYENNQDQLKAVAIDDGNGSPVLPSAETVNDGTYTPLSRPIFIYVKASALEEKPAVRDFVQFYLENAPELVPTVGYVALPSDQYQEGMSKISSR
ncbi:MAG: PstS family phosphate ABC transporter substrate-binding protein [Cyanophyceae cyanobacterium]